MGTSFPTVSLIDLSSLFPFEIDDAVKKEICFGETLIISCGHYEGDVGEDSSESDWTCSDDSSETQLTSQDMKNEAFEIVDKVIEDSTHEDDDDEANDFHFFFYPPCDKPANSHTSLLITADGLPMVNPDNKPPLFCTCGRDKKGMCICHTKLPCKCGATTTKECTCPKAEEICICHDGKPMPVCTCKGSDICMCHPDGKIRPICTCAQIDKPCLCHPGKYPSPVCTCKYKPKFVFDKPHLQSIGEGSYEGEEEESITESEPVPCECQKPDPKPHCMCLRGKDCICNENTCICGVQKTCVCEPADSQDIIECKDQESKSICSCPIPRECTCEGKTNDCKCFPKMVCTCGDPANCICKITCDCTEPCICDTMVNVPKECICQIKTKRDVENVICTCRGKRESKKLKRVRAGKQGYRWCHDVDPKHTFFDYGYGRHGKIDYREKEVEKVKIQGLYEEKEEEELCAVHGVKAPPYKKKVRKPSLDCCSAVGGISVSVETLGEDKDKFLVQVVSHSSKEGAKTGSKLIGILDCNLHTLEENRTEHITKKSMTKERRSYLAICDSGYYNKVTRICGERHVVKRHHHTFDDSRNLLLEAANVVLLRYFGLRRYRGNIKTDTLLINGLICESVYVCLGVSQAIVNGRPLFVVKVERHIIEPTGNIHQTLTVLTLRGYIVSHEWADNCYMLHLNPLLRIVPEKDEIEPHAPLRETWREDLQLFSDYLDFKSARSSEGARYVTESGALTATVRDYLQAILLLRPQDALHFTRHYFSAALSALDLPHDDYFDAASRHVRYYFFEE